MGVPSEKPFGIIFDMDGVMTDSHELIIEAPIKAASAMGINLSGAQEQQCREIMRPDVSGNLTGKAPWFLRAFATLRREKNILPFMVMLYNVAKTIGLPFKKRIEFMKTSGKIYVEEIAIAKFFPGIGDALRNLRQAHSNALHLGILSSGPTGHILDRFKNNPGILDFFDSEDDIIGSDRVKHPKPSPEGIHLLASRWHLPPDRVVMVGDQWFDIEAGKRAGCVTVGVLSGFISRADMEACEPDLIFSDVPEMVEHLEDVLGQLGREKKS
jgi:pyrophosphatase PpaX